MTFARRAARLAPLTALLGPGTALVARAETYMTDVQAATTIFPGSKFERRTLTLSDADAKAVREASGQAVRSKIIVYWKDAGGNAVFVDQVLGKHEFISYAVAVSTAGAVAGVEILEYRETYGGQIRGAAWRRQFVGKTKTCPLKLDADIRNIGGATLSSAHVTNGVKRVLATHDRIRARL